MTYLALHHPRGLQPAAFGHMQTLVNAIDVWAPKMYWGYKVTNQSTGHAGAFYNYLVRILLMKMFRYQRLALTINGHRMKPFISRS